MLSRFDQVRVLPEDPTRVEYPKSPINTYSQTADWYYLYLLVNSSR